MPFPIGHSAIAFTLLEIKSNKKNPNYNWKTVFMVTVLANLPDIDILAGLLLSGNGNLFHRGPTHSIAFALITGFLVSRLGRLWTWVPSFSFFFCFSLVLSHVLADLILTGTPVSLFYPFELNWITGESRWDEVLKSVLFKAGQDAGIVIASLAIISLRRLGLRFGLAPLSLFFATKSNPS